MSRITQQLLSKALSRYQLPIHGFHGPSHWSRVRINGLSIAKLNENVDEAVVEYFSFFHDCCRENEDRDPFHGPTAAKFVEAECRNLVDLSNFQFDQLLEAMIGHTSGDWCSDLTIGACWDADRLDLWRVGILPDARFFSVPESAQLVNDAVSRSQSWIDKYGEAARLRVLTGR
jgi:uncharacterized protein